MWKEFRNKDSKRIKDFLRVSLTEPQQTNERYHRPPDFFLLLHILGRRDRRQETNMNGLIVVQGKNLDLFSSWLPLLHFMWFLRLRHHTFMTTMSILVVVAGSSVSLCIVVLLLVFHHQDLACKNCDNALLDGVTKHNTISSSSFNAFHQQARIMMHITLIQEEY